MEPQSTAHMLYPNYVFNIILILYVFFFFPKFDFKKLGNDWLWLAGRCILLDDSALSIQFTGLAFLKSNENYSRTWLSDDYQNVTYSYQDAYHNKFQMKNWFADKENFSLWAPYSKVKDFRRIYFSSYLNLNQPVNSGIFFVT